MKIESVKCVMYTGESSQNHKVRHIPFTVLSITTDTGIEGYGDFAFNDEITVREIRSELVGRDPFDRELIWQKIWSLLGLGRGRGKQGSLEILSAIDVALWDTAGKALGVPIYKLMGAYRDKVSIYASSSRLTSTQDYVEEAVSCKQKGITAYMIHPPSMESEKHIELCRAVRKAVGDDMKLMFDVHGRYNREEAFRVGRELEKLKFYWFGRPIPDHDIEGLAMLAKKLDVPIFAADDASKSTFSIPEYLIRRAVDIVSCDIRKFGGITPCKKIAAMCNAFGTQCELHHSGRLGACFLLNVAYLHTICSIKNCEFYEMRWPSFRKYGLKEYPELDDKGYIHAPQKPGLGVEIDWEVLGKPVATY